MDPARELLTIQSFRELPEAMMAKGVLDSGGSDCFLVDDNTGRMLGFYFGCNWWYPNSGESH